MKAAAIVVFLIVFGGCATKYPGPYDPSDIWLAVNDGSASRVRYYLQRGASPNTCDETGWSILHNACWGGSPDVVEVLVRGGASVNATGDNIFTSKFEAMWREIPEIKQKIWSATRHATPLHTVISGSAEDKDRERIVRFLLAHGANPQIETRDGFTAVELAAEAQPGVLPLLR